MGPSSIKRILIVRTDRIGDVVLSTPVIKATRSVFPDAFIAMMVSHQTREIVEGNPSLNEVIVYDKKVKDKGFLKSLIFILRLKKKKFDLALILHSTTRINLICFLAGIPKRVGYKKGKLDFLLTDKLEYTKRFGKKHESEYSLDILRFLGLKVENPGLFVPVRKKNEESVNNLLKEYGLKKEEKFIVIHPGASSVSKMWPQEKFAKLADLLIEKFKIPVILISSPDQVEIGEKVKKSMKNKVLFLCGRTSLGELVALFKKTALFISNDSGPVHIACSMGTPIISIFGRNEKGLSPERWCPLGSKDVVIHKDVGCEECLAHNCKKGFLCLNSITEEEVLEKAKTLLG